MRQSLWWSPLYGNSLARAADQGSRKAGAPRVHLVAYSMGGLICRCLIQKIIADRGEHATDYVDRLFTSATPHGGVNVNVGFGLIEKLRGLTGIRGTDVFGPDRMREYLTR